MPIPLPLSKLLIHTGLARFMPGVRRWTDPTFLPYFSDGVLAAPHARLAELATLLEPTGPDGIDLALGAPRFDLVPSGSTKLPADRRGWPPPRGLHELRVAVADKLRREEQLAVSPSEEVLITPGAAGAFSAALGAFVNPGDRVVLFDPTSPLFALALRQRRARVRWVPTWVENGQTRFRLAALAQAMRGAKMIVLASPGNPTGSCFAPEDLEWLAWWAERRNVLLLCDVCFASYRYEGEHASVGAMPKARRRTLTVGGVSQEYALASARVGWLAGHRHLVGPCLLAQTPFVPTLAQQVALTALRLPEERLEPVRAEFASRRQYVYERLQAMDLHPAWPAGAFFFWLPVAGLGCAGRSFAERLWREKNVRVTPGELFGPGGAGFVRLSYAADDGRLREGLGRLAEFLRAPQEASRLPVAA